MKSRRWDALSFALAFIITAGLCLGITAKKENAANTQPPIEAPSNASMAEAERLLGMLEDQFASGTFAAMPAEETAQISGQLGAEIAGCYSFVGLKEPGTARFCLLGVRTSEEKPLAHCDVGHAYSDELGEYSIVRDDADRELARYTGMIFTYRPDAERIILVENGSYDRYFPMMRLVLDKEEEYAAELLARGVKVCQPDEAPYLVVKYFDRGAERTAYVPLTAEDLALAAQDAISYTDREIGESAIRVVLDENGISPSSAVTGHFLRLAEEKCGFSVVSPADIGPIRAAELTVIWQGETRYQKVTDPDQLKTLQEMLAQAKPYESISKCPFTGILTLTMEDGRVLTLHKATDICDTIIFGSMREYMLGTKRSDAFWTIFAEVKP